MIGTVAEVILPPDEFALWGTLSELTDLVFRLERVVAQRPERIMSFVWVGGVDRATLEDAFAADPSVEDAKLVTDLGDRWLYAMDWVDRIEALVRTIVEEEAVLLAANGSAEAWELKFLFLEREAIRRVQESFEERGITFDVHRIYDQRNAALGTHGLTEKQYRALALALERGYYEVPRGVDSQELAAELGVSHQALSELLRRAHEVVVADVVGPKASVLSDATDTP